jgi:hypothetical protein
MFDKKFIKTFQFFDARNRAYSKTIKNYRKNKLDNLDKSAIYLAWKLGGAAGKIQDKIMLGHNALPGDNR